jgi:hypothetical protein
LTDGDHGHSGERPSPDVADLPHDSAEYPADFNRRLRLAYASGLEEWALEALGRPLTADELVAGRRDYPGSLP